MPSDRWHCAQIPNGDTPIVVCEREQLQAERDALTELVQQLGGTCDLYGDGRSWIDCTIELTPAQADLIERINRENP